MSGIERTQVLVVGAGPVGCVAAAYLAQNGIDVILAEAHHDAAQDLRASTFHAPTLEMLDEIGIAQTLIDMGLKAPVYHWRDRKSGEVLAFDLSEIADVARFPFRLQCEQYHLASLLSQRLDAMDAAQVLFNHRLAYFQQDEKGVDAILEHPTGITRVHADYLIGADGANSIVRKLLEVEFDGFTYPEKFLCLSTGQSVDSEIPNLSLVNYISDPDEWLVLLRVPNLWRVLVPASEDESNEDLLADAKKDAVFGGIVSDPSAVQTRHRTIYRVHQRVAQRFRVGRALLVGDAAHLNNPLGGFGMNSGIHDAFSACQKLVAVLRGETDDTILDKFDRQRRTVTHNFTQQQTIENMEMMRAGQSEAHQRRLATMRTLASDTERRRTFLLRQSMFGSLAEAAAIA
jgi:3-(3-hydroxy-phenyl)propionate hydroxylase